jgi:hypothetical protein
LRGCIEDRGLSSGDDIIVVFLINLKRRLISKGKTYGVVPETSAPNLYCLKLEGCMVMYVCHL